MYNPFSTNVYEAERNRSGDWFYKLFKGNNAAIAIKTERERLIAVLTNPAALKVFKLQCDMFSLAEVKAIRNKKVLDNDPLIKFLNQPNNYQNLRQYLWDYMFWTMLGTSYLYTNSKVLSPNTKQYWLDPSRFDFTDEIINAMDKNVISDKAYKDNLKLTIEYSNLDGTVTTYALSEIMPFFDLSNGVGNWFRGNSAVDALYKVISNSDRGLDAKGVNLEFSGKYFISGTHKEEDVFGSPMSGMEKESIEDSVRTSKTVHATKSMVELKRFVDDIAKLKLDEGYMADYFIIGGMYGIPRDVLEVNAGGATFENQEKARVAHVDYCLKPKGQDLMLGLEKLFGYDAKNIDLVISWSHLGFMQVVERERATVKSTQLANLRLAQEMEVLTPDEVILRGKEIMEYDD